MQAKSKAGWVDADDAPELTPEFFQTAEIRLGERVVRRGRPPTGEAKRLVSLRLDPDVLHELRVMGPGWQTQVNAVLRAFVEQRLEKIRR